MTPRCGLQPSRSRAADGEQQAEQPSSGQRWARRGADDGEQQQATALRLSRLQSAEERVVWLFGEQATATRLWTLVFRLWKFGSERLRLQTSRMARG
ncbi:hypothetical protein ACLB2K_046769 [Fragaria x ananassa]